MKDVFGNTNVYNIYKPENTSVGWWYGEKTSNNSSINAIGGLSSGIRGIDNHTNNESTTVSQLSQSISAPAYTTNFADNVTNLESVTNTKNLRRAKRSSKNVAEVAAVEEIKQIAQTVEPVIERAELVQNDTVAIEPVESLVQVADEIIESVPATDNIEKVVAEETQVLPQVNAQISEPVVHSQSQLESQRSLYYDSELKAFDMRSVYVAIAVLIVALSALGGIFITRAKKMKK